MDWEISNFLFIVALFLTVSWCICLCIRWSEQAELEEACSGRRLVSLPLGGDTPSAYHLSRAHLLMLLRASRDSTSSTLKKVAVPFHLRLHGKWKPRVETLQGQSKSLVLVLDSIVDYRVDIFWGVTNNVFDTIEVSAGSSSFQSLSDSFSTVRKSLSILQPLHGQALSQRKVSPRLESTSRPSQSHVSSSAAVTLGILKKNSQEIGPSISMSRGKKKVCTADLPAGFMRLGESTAVVVVSRLPNQKRASWR